MLFCWHRAPYLTQVDNFHLILILLEFVEGLIVEIALCLIKFN